ncbi:MAG: sensor N-terminal transmembrane domain-containing protein [Erythrobacter sp.]|jgi:two-component system, OmpR family, sensor histidine kinase ChvG|uniref:ATP-binding protein n=1 Tax=Qipengyuania TaxID=1855416 RepID=UPI001A3CA9C2|nr:MULTISPECIES: ATP-binding protein [Qipengyuania]MBL4718181.1 sensor N-terminal transmembrane domain-containing protein [Erythrobacter sp.]MCP2017106.1 two-component system sensor histidine kinase ChvG [Qipengyuania citrea]MDE0901149.1 sensor N-terminal transmembrane domain-containing protein [Erythrobacter sp.]WPL56484.1 ATP-binding protein [Qipengyuania sp. HL-TH5]|tara:strand:- start:288750 stop:290315 length:1566 start_codon:yes stop_codon:yes gene_type:complete
MSETGSVLKGDPRIEKQRWSRRLSLTSRILFVNVLPLVLLGGGVIYVDAYRKQLLDERFKLALVEAQITAEALAGATPQRQEALLIQIGKEQRLRLRVYSPDGTLESDSFKLAPPSFVLPSAKEVDQSAFALRLDRWFDRVVGAPALPDYVEPETDDVGDWPELTRAREDSLTQIVLRDAPDGTHVINAAAPVGLDGDTLLLTRNPVDITESVREARSTVALVVLLALVISTLLSFFLAQTIVRPLRELVHAAVRVRQGRDRQVEVPRLPQRRDEIGMLARSISDMTAALRQRIDAVEHFAADVAHEIKNPLASLRSATESLSKVEDPTLRAQLLDIATHDVRRIDRLVTEISDASRIDAEMSRTEFEPVDLAQLLCTIVESREARDENEGRTLEITGADRPARVMGVPVRLERVIQNLLDNAVSFSPPAGRIWADLSRRDDWITLTICDEGPGIPEEKREKVFRRFHSDRPAEEDFGNHSGLGLAIARTIAEAHDGTLVATSRMDGESGACLHLGLPAKR